MKERAQQMISLTLSVISAYLFFSVIYGWIGGRLSFFQPGIFLFQSFHGVALLVPVFIAFQARLLLQESFPKNTFLKLNLAIIPFISAALFIKIIAPGEVSPAEHYFITAFGKPLSILLTLLLTGISSLLIVKVSDYFFPAEGTTLFSLFDWFQDFLPQKDRSEEDTLVDGTKDNSSEHKPVMKKEYQPMIPIAEAYINKGPSAPNLPKGIGDIYKEDENSDEKLHQLIGKVLRGEKHREPSHEEVEVATGKDIQRAFIEENTAIETMEFSNEASSEMKEEEYSPLNSEEREVLSVVAGEKPNLAVSLSREEEKLDSLLSTLDNVLEEERPLSISDKLSPEDPIPTTEISTLKKKAKRKRNIAYNVPVEGVLTQYPGSDYSQVDDDTKRAADVLEETLLEFKIDAQVTGISRGPVITMFELLPAPGVKLSRIVALQDNIALRLAASRVRIVAPIPGKHAVGIEIPNKKRSIVGFSQLVQSDAMTGKDREIPIVLGKDISGGDQVIDLARTPHLLIAGSTGSGKSVCVNSLICSLLYQRSPQDVKMILVDPKIVELKLYNDIPHLLTPVITEPKKAFQAVQWALYEMERRYALLDSMGVRDIKTYNRRIREREMAKEKLPYLVLVIDEFADLMATSGKELEGIVARLAAMSRAVGIHLVLATQRPSTDVITGLIKANFPSRIAFMVASMTDSRIIIDSAGAEKLLGRGDMLFTSSWDPFPTRVQGSFLSEDEVENVVRHVKTLGEPDYIDDEIFTEEEDDDDGFSLSSDYGEDPLFNKALEVVVNSGKASASYLQRRLKIGYNRAARLVEEMEERGIVGPANGSKPRDILHIPDRPMAKSEEPSMVG